MAKMTLHTDRETKEELRKEIPKGESWASYILGAVRLRKRIEGRELMIVEPDTRTVNEKKNVRQLE